MALVLYPELRAGYYDPVEVLGRMTEEDGTEGNFPCFGVALNPLDDAIAALTRSRILNDHNALVQELVALEARG
jgi:hypothetical protein